MGISLIEVNNRAELSPMTSYTKGRGHNASFPIEFSYGDKLADDVAAVPFVLEIS